MKQITFTQIEKVFASAEKHAEDPVEYFIGRLHDEQRFLAEYLLGSDSALNKHERTVLITSAACGWYIIREVLRRRAVISLDYLEERFYDNEMLLVEAFSFLEQEPDINPYALFSLFNRQEELMSFLISTALAYPEKMKKKVREKNLSRIFIHLKTIVDCMVLDEDDWRLSTDEEEPDLEKDLPRITSEVKNLIQPFMKRRLFKKLNAEAREAATFIIQSFAQEMFCQFHLPPSQWRSGPAVACVLFGIPRNFIAPPAVVELIEPVLKAFLLFGSETGAIPRGGRITEALEGLGPLITKREARPHLWGVEKKKIIQAEKKGIDINNFDVLKNYLTKNDSQKIIILDERAQEKDRPKRNDPCPCGSGKKFKNCCGSADTRH